MNGWSRAGGLLTPASRLRRDVVLAAALAGLAAILALAVRHMDAPAAAGAAAAILLALTLLARPRWAACAFTACLFTNLPGVAYKSYGVPQALAAGFMLLLFIPVIRHVIFERRPLRVDPPFALMLAFFTIKALSALVVAVDKDIAAGELVVLATEGLVLYVLVLNAVRDARALRGVLWTSLLSGAFLASLTITQAATGNYHQQFGGFAERRLIHDLRHADPTTVRNNPAAFASRPSGPQLEQNRYAQIMLILLPWVLLCFRLERRRCLRLAAAAAGAAILVGGVVLTYSRGAMVALVALVFIAAGLRWIRRSFVLAAGAAAVLALPVVAPGVVDRVLSLRAVAALGDRPAEADGALRGRATEMMAALLAFRDHPVLGVGPGQYTPIYSARYHQIPEIKFRDIQGTRRGHMLYFEIGAETGLPGLLLFLAIPGWLLRELWRARRRHLHTRPDLAHLATAFGLSITAYLITALFLSLAFQRYYWFLIALSAAAVHILRTESTAPAPEP